MATFDTFKRFFRPGEGGFKGFGQGMIEGYEVGFAGNLLPFLAFGGYGFATAPRGHKLSALAGGGIGFGATAVVGGALAGMVGLPPQIGAFAAGLLFGGAADTAVTNTVQSFVDFGSNMRRLRMGGDYRDSNIAVTMRQVAAREMSRSLLNARQWLGQEASFMAQ